MSWHPLTLGGGARGREIREGTRSGNKQGEPLAKTHKAREDKAGYKRERNLKEIQSRRKARGKKPRREEIRGNGTLDHNHAREN